MPKRSWDKASREEIDAELARLEDEKQAIRARQRELIAIREAKAQEE